MPRKPFDPLAAIPSPGAVRAKLDETLALANRLRLLLDLSEKLDAEGQATLSSEHSRPAGAALATAS